MEICVGLRTLEINVWRTYLYLEDLSIFGGLDYEALHLEVILAMLVDVLEGLLYLEVTFG